MFNKQIGILAVKRETCIDFLSTRTGRLFCHNGSPRSLNWIRVWLGWLVVFCLSSNFFIQSCLQEIFGGIRGDSYTFSCIISPVSTRTTSRNTIGWECIVENDGVRSSLIELQSFLLSKFKVDPIHRVLMFLPCCMHVPCKTQCFQVDLLRIFVFFIHRIHRQKEYCLSFAQNLTSRYQSWIDDGMKLIAYNTEIFSCFLLLPWCSSTFHQTNVENAQNGSEDNLLFSRIQSLHHLPEVGYHDEEDWSVSSTLDSWWANNLVVQYRSTFFHQ